jgi:acyl carrier protein
VLLRLLQDGAGIKVGERDVETSFVELGLDSLFLTQFSVSVSRRFKVNLSFRQLSSNLNSVARLAAFLDDASVREEDERAVPSEAQAGLPAPVQAPPSGPQPRSTGQSMLQGAETDQLIRLFLAQIDILQQQLDALSSAVLTERIPRAPGSASRVVNDAPAPDALAARTPPSTASAPAAAAEVVERSRSDAPGGGARVGFDAAHPPAAGARLGRDPSGKPAWYIPDPNAPGKYLKVV